MAGRVVVVGLGPAGPDLVTPETLAAVERVAVRFVRTTRHPSASVMPAGTRSFDDLYEGADAFADVYRGIADELADAAARYGEVLYAVPGSPRVLERSVELLLGDDRVEVDVLPAVSFLDLVWARLGVDPFEDGVRLVDAHRFAERAAGERGPLLVAHCHANWVLSDVKLAFERETPERAVVLQRLGLPDERVVEVAWDELDRGVEADHLTTVWVPTAAAPVGAELVRFAEVVRRLREECPWDRQQTHQSLARYAIEETYEVVEAIAQVDEDPGAASYSALEEELGDLLLQVFLHAAVAAQAGEFTIADVANAITEKMIRRHPHVFGDVAVDDAAHVARNWDEIKAAEKGRDGGGDARKGALDGVPGALPALTYAAELGRKAAKVGFDWTDPDGVWAKVAEELDELRAEPGSAAELGDVLFAVTNLARHLGHDPEAALRGAAAKFRHRFEVVERLAGERGIELAGAGLAALDELWDEAKSLRSGA
ncbi:MAG TPA: nucleoside triphosphate pyrophosphohydrolase [Acidimicrobiales bacterium]